MLGGGSSAAFDIGKAEPWAVSTTRTRCNLTNSTTAAEPTAEHREDHSLKRTGKCKLENVGAI